MAVAHVMVFATAHGVGEGCLRRLVTDQGLARGVQDLLIETAAAAQGTPSTTSSGSRPAPHPPHPLHSSPQGLHRGVDGGQKGLGWWPGAWVLS